MARLPERARQRTNPPMAQSPPTTPVLFDRALLTHRLARAQKLGPVGFLLDRVAVDFSDRLLAVTRQFSDIADVWTPGGLPLPDGFTSVARLALEADSETLPLAPQSLALAVS